MMTCMMMTLVSDQAGNVAILFGAHTVSVHTYVRTSDVSDSILL